MASWTATSEATPPSAPTLPSDASVASRKCGRGSQARKEHGDRDSPGPTADKGVHGGAALATHRRRQVSIASLIQSLLGDLTAAQPRMWSRHAYLMLVGLIYERLATSESELSTAELVALSKALAEQRRADAGRGRTRRRRQKGGSGKDAEPSIDEIVRDLYGITLDQAACADHSTTSS